MKTTILGLILSFGFSHFALATTICGKTMGFSYNKDSIERAYQLSGFWLKQNTKDIRITYGNSPDLVGFVEALKGNIFICLDKYKLVDRKYAGKKRSYAIVEEYRVWLNGKLIDGLKLKELKKPKSDLLTSLKKSWDSANVEATDKYSQVYGSSVEITSSEVDRALRGDYVEYVEVSVVEVDEDKQQTALELAEMLFTADPYIDGESLADIGPVVESLAQVLGDSNYTVYTVDSGGLTFHGSHSSVVVVSEQNLEMLVLTAGYSE